MSKSSGSNGEFYRESYYTLREFCQKLGCSVKTVRTKYVATGKLLVSEIARGYEIVLGYEAARFFDELFGEDEDAQGGCSGADTGEFSRN